MTAIRARPYAASAGSAFTAPRHRPRLGVPRRTLQRWAAGEARPPPTLRRDLARLVAARQDTLGKLYRELVSG
jgi:hypothetical protein